MELRKLCARDLFSMVKILNGIGLKNIQNAINVDEIKEARKKVADGNTADVIGDLGVTIVTSIVGVLLENLPSIEKDLYSFMGGVANMKASDVANMDIADFMELLVAIIKKEEFKDFFNQASKLIK